jgi:hypothetical protein
VAARFGRHEALFCLALLVYSIVAGLRQPVISQNDGKGMDGFAYARMAETLDFATVPAPFRYRVLLPLLTHPAIRAGYGVVSVFRALNWSLAFALFAVLLVLLERLPSTSFSPAALVVGLMATSGLSPLRLAFFYPVLTDTMHLLLTTLVLWIGLFPPPATRASDGSVAARAMILAALFYLGTLNRENFLAVLPCLLPWVIRVQGRTIVLSRSPARWAIACGVPVLACGAGLFTVRALTGAPQIGNGLSGMVDSLLAMTLPRLFVIVCLVFGPLLVIAIGDRRSHPASATRGAATVGLAATLFLVVTGGSNPERFLFWAMPFACVLAAPSFEAAVADRRWALFAICFALHIAFQSPFSSVERSAFGARGPGQDYPFADIALGRGPSLIHWTAFATREMQLKVGLLTAAGLSLALLSRSSFERAPSYTSADPDKRA